MKLNAKTKAAIAAKKTITRKAGKTGSTSRIASQQWKLNKAAKIDNALGYGGVYNLRKQDITDNLLVSRKAGAATRSVRIFSGTQGLCFLDGAFVGDTLNVGTHGIDTSKIVSNRVLFKGGIANAVAFVRKHGKSLDGRTKQGDRFNVLWDSGEQYSIATDGKRLLRVEQRVTTEGSKKYQYTLGK